MAAALIAPSGVLALSAPRAAATAPAELTAHSASTSTPDSNGELTAVATCGNNQQPISGGFRSAQPLALVASYKGGLSWSTSGYGDGKLTTFAYCAPDGGQVAITAAASTGISPPSRRRIPPR